MSLALPYKQSDKTPSIAISKHFKTFFFLPLFFETDLTALSSTLVNKS